MSRRTKLLRNIAIGLAALLAVAGIALMVVRTDRFQQYVKQKIVAAIAEGTGGATEIGSFTLDVTHMHARILNLVIHGSEPAGAAPFVRVTQVDLNARLFGGGHIVGISYLGIQQPAVNVLVFGDGRTNLPTPKPSAPSKETPLETVVDLAVGQFDLRDGQLNFNSQKQPLEVHAQNLRAQLWYHLLQGDYEGRLSLEPIYVVSGRKVPVTYRVTLPVALERDRIRLHDASIATATSLIQIDGAMENLRQPAFSGHIRGRVSLADLQNTADVPLDTSGRGLPDAIQLEANAISSADSIRVTAFKVSLGNSSVEASGVLKDPHGGNTLKFDGQLALAELARLARSTARPQGTVVLSGEATLAANNSYQVSGRVSTRGFALDQGTLRIRNAELSTDLRVTPARVELNGLRLAAFGGDFTGNATLEDFAHYKLNGSLRRLDIAALEHLVQQRLPYTGTISGPVQASGDLHAPGTQSIDARASLSIAPGSSGIPLRGRLQADYSGARDDVSIQDSYLALPHTRLTLAGSVQHGLNISLTTHDLNDLPAAASAGSPPVTLAGGEATITAVVKGGLTAPRIAGHLSANRFQVEGRAFDRLSAEVAASQSGAAVSNGTLARGTMLAAFSANVGMKSWKPDAHEPVSADVTLQNADLADIMVMAGQPSQQFSGALNASLRVAGTVGNPSGSASLHAANGTLRGEPFDRLDAQVSLTDQLAAIQSASLVAGNARADLTAEFQHPRDSFTSGRIHAHIQTNQIELAQIRTLQKQSANAGGQLQINAEVAGDLSSQTEFLLTTLQADGSVRGLRFHGQQYGDFEAKAHTSGQTATVDVTSNFAGSNIRVQGTTQLVHGYPTDAAVQMRGLPVERVLALAERNDIPVRGKLSADAHLHGTLDNPEGDATLDLANAVVSDEPLDRVQMRISYQPQRIDLSQFDVAAGPSRIALTARFDHPAGHMDAGNIQFRIANSHLDLGRLHNLQKLRPGLAGTVQISADGGATLAAASPRVLLSSLNTNVDAANITSGGQNLGSFKLAAQTTSGNRLSFTLDSDLAGATLQARGNGQLGGDYPIDAQLSFSKVKWTRLQTLLGTAATAPPSFEVTAEGKATVNGPALQMDRLRGSLQIAHLELQTLPGAGGGKSITIQNQGPVEATLDQGTVRLANFHFTGPQTDLQAAGTISTKAQTLQVSVNAGVDLAVLRNFSRDIISSGSIKLASDVHGSLSNPLANGSLELHNATLNYTGMPLGLANANGVVSLRGNRATIQNLTAEAGGGKLTVSGFATIGDTYRFALRAGASKVRVQVQEGVSIVAAADVHVAGTPERSTATGTVTVEQLNYAPRSDLGSVLTRAAPPVESTSNPQPVLDNMKLDVRVRTSTAMRVEASLAENLQTEADLRIGGSASRPSVLGRVSLTEGQLVFFGSTYTVNTGTISFFNPVRIEPILNLSLETQSQGVDVVLNVTGPLDNMTLTYTSDPPLEFQEIVGLLAAGTTPTSDPTLLANQPSPPPQTFEQRGESAIVGQAVANPIASQLQRVFGVSQLKINPSFSGSSALPTAQVTLQQQISTNLTFTYVSALDNPNSTLIRADWALNREWSAAAIRDQNGIFSINLLYKRQFR